MWTITRQSLAVRTVAPGACVLWTMWTIGQQVQAVRAWAVWTMWTIGQQARAVRNVRGACGRGRGFVDNVDHVDHDLKSVDPLWGRGRETSVQSLLYIHTVYIFSVSRLSTPLSTLST